MKIPVLGKVFCSNSDEEIDRVVAPLAALATHRDREPKTRSRLVFTTITHQQVER
jgi:hypothetical protein